MRKIRGVHKLAEYLKSIDCPISTATINRLLKEKRIPHSRPTDRVIIYDLDEIDEWLGVGTKEERSC